MKSIANKFCVDRRTSAFPQYAKFALQRDQRSTSASNHIGPQRDHLGSESNISFTKYESINLRS